MASHLGERDASHPARVEQIPGGHFVTKYFLAQHDRRIATWNLVDGGVRIDVPRRRGQGMASLPDVLEPALSVVFCGINPGNQAAALGHHFAGRSNRFWRVLHLAGFTPHLIAAENDRSLLGYHCGLTSVVERPTAGANELARHEFEAAAARLERKVRRYAPTVVAFLGKVAYAGMTRQRQLAWGEQPAAFGGARVWLLPNPSGRNRNFTLDALVTAYRELRVALR